VYPIRLATCNLHGESTKAGISIVVPVINVRQFVMSVPVNRPFDGESPVWLEAGGVCLGPLSIDAAMALPRPELRVCQDQFLKLHDKKTRRLSFLWPGAVGASGGGGKCGCLGGCKFFGTNRNGERFLQPSDSDFGEGLSSAVFMLCTDGETVGYGQSLLSYNSYVFDYQPSCFVVSEKRLKSMRATAQKLVATSLNQAGADYSKMSPPIRQTTIVGLDSVKEDSLAEQREGPSGRSAVVSSSGSQRITGGFEQLPWRGGTVQCDAVDGSNRSPADDEPFGQDLGVVNESDLKTSSSGGGPNTAGRTSSVTSLPEVAEKKQPGHTRQHSYDVSTSNRSSNANTSGDTRPTTAYESKPVRTQSSLSSNSGNENRKSVAGERSFTSPVLRRLSSQMSVHFATSLSTSSELFFSAQEDVSSGSSNLSSSSETLEDDNEFDDLADLSTTLKPHDSSIMSAVGDDGGDLDWTQRTLTRDAQSNKTNNAKIPEAFGGSGYDFDDTESLDSFVSAATAQGARSRTNLLDDDDDDELKTAAGKKRGKAETPSLQHFLPQHHMIDLHGQINQQISLSPLLMNCYRAHMTQLRCDYWTLGSPLACVISPKGGGHRSTPSQGDKTPPVPLWIPQFSYVSQGFTPRLVSTRKVPYTPPGVSTAATESGGRQFFGEKSHTRT
jgi:hypothetical protein